MKILLYMFGTAAFFLPLVLWSYMADIACANMADSANITDSAEASPCGLSFGDFLDWGFFNVALLPWAISFMCFVSGRRKGRGIKS